MTSQESLIDRAAGVLVGQACGDVLGVPYEFGPPHASGWEPQMVGGGPFNHEPGEYSDDTAMAVCIASVAASGVCVGSQQGREAIARNFLDWARGTKDIGAQTRNVLWNVDDNSESVLTEVITRAMAYHQQHPDNSAGNGALMRTAVVGLVNLESRIRTATDAARIAALTHYDVLCQESCVLWSEAVRIAVTEQRFDLEGGLDLILGRNRDRWAARIDEATGADPRRFNPNGFTVTAMQAAWAAITSVPESGDHFREALCEAIRAGNDTDTVGAIAGGLLGARWGRSAIPAEWQDAVWGYGDCRADELAQLGVRSAGLG